MQQSTKQNTGLRGRPRQAQLVRRSGTWRRVIARNARSVALLLAQRPISGRRCAPEGRVV